MNQLPHHEKIGRKAPHPKTWHFFVGETFGSNFETFFLLSFWKSRNFSETVCKHIKTPDVTVYQWVFRKITGGFWAVSKAGTMASVRTSVKQS